MKKEFDPLKFVINLGARADQIGLTGIDLIIVTSPHSTTPEKIGITVGCIAGVGGIECVRRGVIRLLDSSSQ